MNAGDKVVPASSGKVQPLASDLDGYVLGTALEDGAPSTGEPLEWTSISKSTGPGPTGTPEI